MSGLVRAGGDNDHRRTFESMRPFVQRPSLKELESVVHHACVGVLYRTSVLFVGFHLCDRGRVKRGVMRVKRGDNGVMGVIGGFRKWG